MIDLSKISDEPGNIDVLTRLAVNGFVEIVWENNECKFYIAESQLEMLTSLDENSFWEIAQ